MASSLSIDNTVELLGGGVQSANAQCPGAIFRLAPNFDLSAPQPDQDLVASLILDGERPFGRRASNRTISLDIVIQIPIGTTGARQILAGARELLMTAIDQDKFSLIWTRDGGLPMILDCFRALPTVVQYSEAWDRSLICKMTVQIPALPYGRSDTPEVLTFASPATGSIAPPSPVTLDPTTSLGSGSHFTLATVGIVGTHSAHWASSDGANGVPSYSKTFSATDITGLSALSFWLGLGAADFNDWHQGNVTFGMSLTDSHGHTVRFSTTSFCTASNNTTAPNWQLITLSIPDDGVTDFTSVTGYTFTCSNFSSFFYGTFMSADTYINAVVANPTSTGVAASTRGSIYNLFGIKGTARSLLNLQIQQPAVSIAESVTITATGAGSFLPEFGVSNLTVEKWAAGPPGGSRTTSGQAAGGLGGEYTKNTAFPCTPGVPIPYFVGAGGTPSTTAPTDGADTWFGANDSTAAHGATAPTLNTSTATSTAHGVSTDPVHHAGGAPAAGSTTGGGGGESGGPASAGNAASGATGGTGQTDAGDGGAGGAAGVHAGSAGVQPGGAGGGASTTGAATLGGAGGNGQIRVSWTRTMQTFKTFIVHRPSQDAPSALSPFTDVGDGLDTPNGLTEYTVPSLVSGVSAVFGGTYTFTGVAETLNTPSSARTWTITVKQYEYAGGPSYSQSVSRTFTPSTDVTNGIVPLGELTLPGKDIAPDNSGAIFTITVTSTNTSDRLLDVLAIDTQGQTIMVNEPSQGYVNFYCDQPDPDFSVGRVLGSAFDRSDAISVIDNAIVSGGPLVVYPGDQILFAYCLEGAPALVAFHNPAWYLDRLS